MAEKLTDYKFTRGRIGTQYPWGEWLDGNIWKLTAGVDFTCKPGSMRTNTWKAAKAHGVSVRTSMPGDGSLILQAILPEA